MADEAQVRGSLFIRKTDANGNVILEYRSQPTAFNSDVSGTKGPVPGSFTALTSGTNVDFSQLDVPGLAAIKNYDDTNYVTYGILDPETGVFYPIHEIQPGESWPVRFSRHLADEYGTGSGTGTVGPTTNLVRFVANAANCEVSVEAFEA